MVPAMSELFFFLNKVVISGAVIGSIYALGAVGVTLVFGILRFAHFAHADVMTVGAFIAFVGAMLLAGNEQFLGIPGAILFLPVAMVLTAILAIGLDRAFYKPLRDAGARPVALVMASIGVTLMIQGLIRLFAGPRARQMYIAERKDVYRIDVLGERITITEPQLWLLAITLVSVVALAVFLTRSRLGKAMRAVSDNPDLARVSGISVQTVVNATWIIAGALAAIAGTMLALDVTLKPDLSFNILLPIFAAAIVGGIGQPFGAVAGGFLIGFSEVLAVFNWGVLFRALNRLTPDMLDLPTRVQVVPSEYKLMIPFVILIAVLIVRPTGIFKGRVI